MRVRLVSWKKIFVTTDVIRAMLQQESDLVPADAASREHFPAQKRRLVGVPVSIVLDPVYPGNRNRL